MSDALPLRLEYPWTVGPQERLRAIRTALPELARSHAWCRPPHTLAAEMHRMTLCRQRWCAMAEFDFAVIETASGRFVGEVGLDRLDFTRSCAELSYWIRRDRRRRGQATLAASMLACFAFRELELARLHICIAGDNPASIGVARRLGARPEEAPPARRRAAGAPSERHVFTLHASRCGEMLERYARSYLQHSTGEEGVYEANFK